MSRPTASSDKGSKRPINSEAAEQLVLEITHSIAQRSVAARRRRKEAARQAEPVPAEPEQKPEAVAAPAPQALAPVSAPVEEKPASIVVDTPPVSSIPLVPSNAEPASRTDDAVIVHATASPGEQRTLAMFYYDEPESPIGAYIAHSAQALIEAGVAVHVFTRKAFASGISGARVHEHVVGEDSSDDLLDRVRSFGARAAAAFRKHIKSTQNVVLMGHEWSSVPAISAIAEKTQAPSILSIDSLETQRSDMSSALSREIQKIEAQGLRCAGSVLLRKGETHPHATQLAPECAGKLTYALLPFATRAVPADFDAGAVKARYQIGPVDPTILFVGDLDERHGPDALMKAIPVILKNNKQARFIFVGDGALQWPLRVHVRYLLLEHAVRIAGHVGGDALLDLIQAADIVAVPSRAPTEDWPVLAAWAAKRPVLTTHAMASGSKLLEHEVNSVLCYPNENSMVWGVERLLFDEGLRKKAGENGAQVLEQRFGWKSSAEQIAGLMGTLAKI